MITNATLLTKEISQELVKLGLNMLWVSLDGATPESYTDIRLGAALPKVLENLDHFREARFNKGNYGGHHYVPDFTTRLGIEFVAMKRNINDYRQCWNWRTIRRGRVHRDQCFTVHKGHGR